MLCTLGANPVEAAGYGWPYPDGTSPEVEEHSRSTRGAHEANALSPPNHQARTTPAIRQVRGRYEASLLSRPASRHHVDHQDRHMFRYAWILRSATASEVTPPPATPLD